MKAFSKFFPSVSKQPGLKSVTLLVEAGTDTNYLVCKVYQNRDLFWREVCLLRTVQNCVGAGELALVDERKLTLYIKFCGPATVQISEGKLNEVLDKQRRILNYREELLTESCKKRTTDSCSRKRSKY